jgi:hypothetical protein
LRKGADERDVSGNLGDVLPEEAVIYLENRGIAGRSLNTVLKHLDGLYGTTLTSNPVMAQTQLDKLVRSPKEPAYRYARRVMMLAIAAIVPGEDIDLKAQRAFVKGINCEVTGPKLRKTLEKLDCTFVSLVKVAELMESRNLLKWEDPVMTKYITDVCQVTAPSERWGRGPLITPKLPEWKSPTLTPCRPTAPVGLKPLVTNADRWATYGPIASPLGLTYA